MLCTSAQLFPSLYDGNIKLIQISTPLRASAPYWLPPGEIRVLTATPDVDGETFRLGEISATDEVRSLAVPPSNVWAVWATDCDAKPAVDRLIAWWQKTGNISIVPKVYIGASEGLERIIFERALVEANELYRRNQDLQVSLSALRDIRACAVSIPQEVSELLQNLRLAPHQLIYGNSPAATDGHEPATTIPPAAGVDGSVAALVQRLPVWARGLAGIDLHIAEAAAGDGVLAASLHAQDAGEDIAHWHIPFSELSTGWLPLRLEAVCSMPFRALNLRVRSVTKSGAVPRLSLALTGALEEFALRSELSPNTAAEVIPNAPDRMLALRLWGGAPGVANASARHLTPHPLPAGLICRVPHSVVAQAQLVHDYCASYTVFRSLRPGSLLVHPVHGTVVAAQLRLPAEAGLILVGCEVMVEDRRCETPVACKLVVAPSTITADSAQREEGILGTSGWEIIERPVRPHALAARLAQPWPRPTNIYLFSKYSGQGNGWHAQTVFSHFQIELDWQAAWVGGP